VYGGTEKFQSDPHWRDLVLFYEYFHGDSGAGLGASHQTGWTGLVAPLLDLFGRVSAEDALQTSKERLQARVVRAQVDGEGKQEQP
jgi:acetylornithine/succinyldiaminopimelate/putrescine aminotransferase